MAPLTARLGLAIALLALLAPGAARAAETPQVAVTPAGAATFVWEGMDADYKRVIRTRARSAGGVLGAKADLSPTGVEGTVPQVALEGDGDARFVWLSDSEPSYLTRFTVQTRRRTAAGALTPVQSVSVTSQYINDPDVAVDPAGNAVFVWLRHNGTANLVETRSISAAGVLSPIRTLATVGDDPYTAPQVAIDSAGRATFVWHKKIDLYSQVIQTSRLALGGTPTAAQNLTDPTPNLTASRPRVVLEADGDATFAWTRMDTTGHNRVETRSRTVAGVLSTARTLSPSGTSSNVPELAVTPDGAATFTWILTDPATAKGVVQTRLRTATGVLGTIRSLTAASGPAAYLPEVGVDQDGDASYVYASSDGLSDRALTRSRSAAGALSAVQTLSPAYTNAKRTGLAVDQDGDTTFVWLRGAQIEGRKRTATGTLGAVIAVGN